MGLTIGYPYRVLLTPTSISTAKTLVQIKTGAAAIEIVKVRVFQATRTATEFWDILLNQYTAAPTFGTVTSHTPAPLNPLDPAALAVGGTSATGVNASAEPSGGTVVVADETSFNVINGEWQYLPVPEDRIRIKQGGLGFTLKLNTAPGAASNIGCVVDFIEYQ